MTAIKGVDMKKPSIRCFEDLDSLAQHSPHVLTLFSGGLDSSYVLKELSARNLKVTALCVDVGEGSNIHDLQEITQFFGVGLEILDAREEFVKDAVLPAICAQAKYMGIYPVSSSLSRPILARAAVHVAQRLGCQAIIHTANQSQNSLRRLNGAIAQVGYDGWFGTPYEFSVMTREEKIEALRNLGLSRFQARGISGDANLWCREFESGALDNPESFWVPKSLFEWTREHEEVNLPQEISISFAQGKPTHVDGVPISALDLIALLNKVIGKYGIGRFSGLEHLEGGEKVLEVREAPAAMVLMDAYRHLETATLSAELLREKLALEQVWVREAIEGRWFAPLRAAVDAFIQSTSGSVTGTVSYALRNGAMDVCSIKADKALYLTDRDAWEKQVASCEPRIPARDTSQQVERCA
jgi:argininosuccinate synthase